MNIKNQAAAIENLETNSFKQVDDTPCEIK
jgi:hypothetical protein